MKYLTVGFLSLILVATYLFRYEDSPRQYVLPVGTAEQFVGSAVVVAPGVLVTANHVATETTVVLYKEAFIPITIVYQDKTNDVAVLQAPGVACPCVPIQTTLPALDEEVTKVGFALYPTLRVQNMSEGRYQGEAINSTNMHYFVFSANVAPGDSGGGVFVKHLGVYYLVGITDAIAVYDGVLFPVLFSSFAIAVPIKEIPSASLLGR